MCLVLFNTFNTTRLMPGSDVSLLKYSHSHFQIPICQLCVSCLYIFVLSLHNILKVVL